MKRLVEGSCDQKHIVHIGYIGAFEELRAERRREAKLKALMDAEANAQVQREEEERLWRADAARRPASPAAGWTPPADWGESGGWSEGSFGFLLVGTYSDSLTNNS